MTRSCLCLRPSDELVCWDTGYASDLMEMGHDTYLMSYYAHLAGLRVAVPCNQNTNNDITQPRTQQAVKVMVEKYTPSLLVINPIVYGQKGWLPHHEIQQWPFRLV